MPFFITAHYDEILHSRTSSNPRPNAHFGHHYCSKRLFWAVNAGAAGWASAIAALLVL
jgi:hypothetical protein